MSNNPRGRKHRRFKRKNRSMNEDVHSDNDKSNSENSGLGNISRIHSIENIIT